MVRMLSAIGLLLAFHSSAACESFEIPARFEKLWQSEQAEYQQPRGQLTAAYATSDDSDARTSPVLVEPKCAVLRDLNGDGEDDFAGIFRYVGPQKRTDNWSLDLVIMYSHNGRTERRIFPYAGRMSADNEAIDFFLTTREAGEIDLRPGKLVVQQPSLVAYRGGEPAVVYYWNGRQLVQRAIGVDD